MTQEEETNLDKRATELAEDAEQHAGEKPGKQVKGIVSKTARNVFSMKIGVEELEVLSDAAEEAGVSLGAYIRGAALEKAQRREPEDERIKDVRKRTEELVESVERL